MRSLLYIFLFVLISCTQNSKTLPGSTGSTNEIIVVIDDNLWNESYSDLFRSVFEKELIENNKISIFGNGERIIPQLEVKELNKIVNKFINNPVVGVFNIAKENVTLVTIAERIIKEKGDSKSEIILVNKGNSNKFSLNLNKINKIN